MTYKIVLLLLLCGNLFALEAVESKSSLNSKCLRVFGRDLAYYEDMVKEFPRWESLLTRSLIGHSTREITKLLRDFLREREIQLAPEAFLITYGEGVTLLNEWLDLYAVKIRTGETLGHVLEEAKSLDDIEVIERRILQYHEDLYSYLLLQEVKRRKK